jgi:hypothetical protein
MTEIHADKLLSYELAGGDLGEEHRFSGFAAHIADRPLGVSFAALFGNEGQTNKTKLYERFSVWVVPHRLSLIRRKGLSEPVSVGLEIEYQNGQKKCSVLGLFPSFEFTNVGGISGAFAAHADLGGNLSVAGIAGPSVGEKEIGSLRVALETTGGVNLRLSCQVFTPKVMAVGVESSRCEWRFDVADSPLYGKDIETWSLVALPKVQRMLKYRMRFYVVTRLAFVPQRFESSWEDVECQLEIPGLSVRMTGLF